MKLAPTIKAKTDQLNAEDLLEGPITITITNIRQGSEEQPVIMHYENDNGRPYKPGKSMRRVLYHLWGNDTDPFIGRRMTLYCDKSVKFGGEQVGGIRISHLSHINGQQRVMLQASRGNKKPFVVKQLAETADGQIKVDAEAAANQGKEEFVKFWNSAAGKANRKYLSTIKDDLQKLVDAAEEANKPLASHLSEDTATDAPEGSGDVIEGDTSSAEYEEGRVAFEDGKAFADCPYGENSQMQADWQAGWTDLEKEAKGEAG